jgi:hypothetical protein|uniref:Uncharacterized protein n=1 Tax=Siphoviridae sp. ctXZx16 TaxID=2826371 RepID=A0A8S5MLR1_9CAUD|nr:MAG TPA: hypothetical protein [Siphoviridae sp. ctXZx16]
MNVVKNTFNKNIEEGDAMTEEEITHKLYLLSYSQREVVGNIINILLESKKDTK